MMHRKEWCAVLIVIAVGVCALLYTASRAIGQVVALQNDAANFPVADTIGWTVYHNAAFGFSVQYPGSWQLNTSGLAAGTPFFALGNPLSGTSTYTLYIFIEHNPQGLSSGAYVHQLLAANQAEDAANASSGPAPRMTPQYADNFPVTAGSLAGYELSRVFEFDRHGDRIYVAHGTSTIRFDFPSAEENPNISLPVANNQIAREIVNTLAF